MLSSFAYRPGASHVIAFDTPVSLRAATGGPSGLFFDAVLRFTLAEIGGSRAGHQWRATTTLYEYRLLDHRLEEQPVYHWQPGPDFAGLDHPHVHVSATLDVQIDALSRRAIDLDKLHIPTGHVTLQDMIRMLITEFQVAPRRTDWRETLGRMDSED